MDLKRNEEDLEQERLKKGKKGKKEVDELRGPEIDSEKEQRLGTLR